MAQISRPDASKLQGRATCSRRILARCTALLMGAPLPAQALAQQFLLPSAAFIQAGTARRTHEATAGLVWNSARDWHLGTGVVTLYWEASFSRWSYLDIDQRRSAWLGQAGLIPVFRVRPSKGASPWFFEGGIGLTLMTTLYKTDQKRFSTRFNFGDHIGFGFDFGTRREHELALRYEHFSNAGIKRPNPGEDFTQIRYLFRFE